jgi:hypothetical protein
LSVGRSTITGVEDDEPTWQKIKGILIHRCVLAAAAKWLALTDAAKDDGSGEPLFVSEARWMARKLSSALQEALRAEEDEESLGRDLAWALIDAGGPRWIGNYNDFKYGLKPGEQQAALSGLEDQAVFVARELLRKADADRWRFMLSEVQNPFAFPGAEDAAERKASRSRLDLMVQRRPTREGRERPLLIIDLKTTTGPVPAEKLRKGEIEVIEKYGRPAARILGRAVCCRVVNVTFDLQHAAWSDGELVAPPTDHGVAENAEAP